MKKAIFIILILFLGMIVPFSGSRSAEQPAPYLLGFTLDMTGLRASLGIPEKRGAIIAIEEINAAGGINGRKLEALFYDGQSDPVTNVKNTKKIIHVDKAITCLGYSAVDGTLASLQSATDAEISLFSAAPSIVTGKAPAKWLFGVVPDQRIASIPVLIQNLLNRGSTKLAYIYIDTAYGMLGKAALEVSCNKLGVTPVIIEKYAPQAVDVSPQLTHIKASGANGLLITGNLEDTLRVLKTAKGLGLNYPIVCDYAIVGPEFIQLGGDLVEGMVTTISKAMIAADLPDTDIQKNGCIKFYNEYVKRHKDYSHYAGNTWDQVNIIAKALEKVDPKLDPKKDEDLKIIRIQLRDNVEKIQGLVGQNGVFNFSPMNHVGLEVGCYATVEVRNGKWRLYKR